MKKIMLILAASLLFQSFSGLSTVSAEGSSDHVIYSFDSGAQGWALGTGTGNPALDYASDGDNGYLKLKASADAVYKLKDGIDVVPNAFIELAQPFKIEADSEIVVSVDVRTSDMSTFVRGLMINRDQLDDAVKNELQYNLSTLWLWNKSNRLYTCEKNSSTDLGSYMGAKSTKIGENVLENGVWYTFKTILYSDENGYPEYIKVSIYDGDILKAESAKSEIENGTLKLSDSITRLDIALMQSTVTVPAGGAEVDFDNVKIYKVSNGRTWSIANLPGNGILTNAQKIGVSFSGKMDESTLNDTNIKLIKEGTNVAYQGEYNNSSNIYSITPTGGLTSGKYSVTIDKSAVNGIDESGNTIFGLDANAEEKIEFTVFNGSIPEVRNINISGKVMSNSVLKASGEYYQAEEIPGYLEYQWYYADVEDGNYSAIQNAINDEFTVPSKYADKCIKCAIVAVTNEGIKGEKAYSDAIKPQKKPEAKNVELSGVAIKGMQLCVGYDFYDENGDEEGKTEFVWLVSDDGMTDWQEIEGQNSDTLVLNGALEGKYIKAGVIPVSKAEPYKGEIYETAAVGPIEGKEGLNLVTNPGFETGTSKGWEVRNQDGDSAKIVATTEDAYSGTWSGKLSGQTSNSTLLRNYVNVKKGLKYIVSTMVKVAPESAVDSARMDYYSGVSLSGTEVTEVGTFTATKDEWRQIIALVVPGGDASKYVLLPQYWSSSGKGAVFYYDDYYFAPLIIDDVITTTPESMDIPTSGEVSSPISIIAIRNQLGTSDGLENETAYWEIDGKGVYIKDNKLYVTSEAVSGTVNLKAVVKPSFDSEVQSIYVKNIPITLVTNSNKTPKITNAVLSGNTAFGSKVTLDYNFYQVDGLFDKSIIKWYVSDSENGTYTEIAGFSGLTLDITEEYSGKFIKVEITPVDAGNHEGSKFVVNVAGPKRKPEARNITIAGKGYVGDTLSGSYEYYDFNGDKEGASAVRWLKSGSENGTYTEIAGADTLNYTVTEGDIGCWFKMEVTPVSEDEPYNGEPSLSNALQGPAVPTATDVEIVKSGKILTGKYKFNSINGVEEGKTLCEWLIDGRVVSTGTVYTADFTGSKNVEFRVTPVAVKMPYQGVSVSATKAVSNGSSSSSGGGGGGGVSMVSSSALPQLPQTQPSEPATGGDIADISGHWSEKYAKEAIDRGIMTLDSAKNFYPDKKVTRSEIITYIFRALGCTETDYRNEFGDVSASASYAKMLQTMVDKGIISKDTNFRPDDNVSRQEVCKILSVALGFSETELDLAKYADNYLIGDWAIPYVKNIVYSNLMTGVSETEFSPRTDITNGQIAKIVSMIHAGDYNKPEGGEQTNKQNFGGKIDLSSNDLKVVFIGGSLTQGGKVWEDMTIEALKAKLPGKNITYENMGLGGTGSGYGAFRYQHDVLSKNPDIVFIEFAINDKSAVGINNSRYMEEMVRQSLRNEKVPAIIFLYAPDPKAVATGEFEPWQTGVGYKEKLAQYYGIKSVNISDYMLWDIENQGIDRVNYINNYYKSTGAGSWDVHGGYPKYGEAIVKAIEEDYESFLIVPRNEAVYHEENAIDINYTVIPASSADITYEGNWTKCVDGEFKEFDDNSKITDAQFQYFGGALMQTLKGDASFEFRTDARSVKLQYISSKAGNDAKVYVDGVEKGSVTTYSVNAGMNYDTAWTELPGDGKEHTVKYVVEKPTSGNYVFIFGSIIERRK